MLTSENVVKPYANYAVKSITCI